MRLTWLWFSAVLWHVWGVAYALLRMLCSPAKGLSQLQMKGLLVLAMLFIDHSLQLQKQCLHGMHGESYSRPRPPPAAGNPGEEVDVLDLATTGLLHMKTPWAVWGPVLHEENQQQNENANNRSCWDLFSEPRDALEEAAHKDFGILAAGHGFDVESLVDPTSTWARQTQTRPGLSAPRQRSNSSCQRAGGAGTDG